MNSGTMSNLEHEFSKLPIAVKDAFEKSSPILNDIFKEDELGSWANEGIAISKQTARSWEAGVEYFRISGDVARHLPFSSFIQWARCGSYLAQDSPTLAVSYFRASPAIVPNLRAQHIARWAGLGRGMYRGTWKSSTLASKFFDVSPSLIRNLPFWDVEVFAGLIETMSAKSYDLASECLILGEQTLPTMGREREAFLSLCRVLTESTWREIKACFEIAAKALAEIEESQKGRFIRLAEQLAKEGARDSSAFLVRGSTSLGKIQPSAQQHILDLCETLLTISPQAVNSLLKSLDYVLERITPAQLDA
ncbi:hypothetical protein FIM12_07990, partial [SAR202 cluster bacterium AD-804-J14_MRT_500m]|nr:hypothetical protein [SAR202 cluster bacterium AD-804-J14_MRT_500m]